MMIDLPEPPAGAVVLVKIEGGAYSHVTLSIDMLGEPEVMTELPGVLDDSLAKLRAESPSYYDLAREMPGARP